ncbi:MAG TPA: alpha/beta fold hydrolase [Candidatus Saccharimonadales bacterium]|nr:alpha/beta fold hydrolase [Candidatus Saccharimonadales bacterium]
MPRKTSNPADYIVPLNINGLEGRMLHVAASAGHERHILFIYGHHALLERWWTFIENLNNYGDVTMPDLPGFGGMDSFSKIGKKPTIDNFADYLAAFIHLRFKRKRITIVAVSFGFVIATRMLQRYPELVKKVDLVVSIVGFMHRDDFVYAPGRRRLYSRATRLFATRPISGFEKYFLLNRPILKYLYAKLPNSKRRMIEVGPEEFEATIDFEVKLWQANDVRTHWLTTSEFLKVDNCDRRVDLPVMHVVTKQDHYFDNDIVKQHMLVVFTGYRQFMANSKAHTPSVLADKKAAGVLLPPGLRRRLAKS